VAAAVSTRIRTGLSQVCADCSAAAYWNEWLGTTRSSRSAVITIVAGWHPGFTLCSGE